MGLHDVIAAGHQGQCFALLARRFMIHEKQAAVAVRHLLPALTLPLETWVTSPSGLDAFLQMMSRGRHDDTLVSPTIFNNQFERNRGQQLLALIRQSMEIDGADLARAAEASGLSFRIVLQLMPFVALFLMAALRQTLEQPSRAILARRLGAAHARSPDPFSDLAELVRSESASPRGSMFGGLFGSLLNRRGAEADATA
jgi:hypothetical protein